MKSTQFKLKALAGLITASMLSACGGGGDSGTANLLPDSSNLTGTVPGTLIEAFCNDGSYHSISSQVSDSTQHPFTLPIPVGLTCSIVMTMNEDDPDNKVITPLTFSDGTTTSTAIELTGTSLDLGYVDLPSTGSSFQKLVLDIEGKDAELSTTVATVLDTDSDGIPNVYDSDYNATNDADQDGIDDSQDTDVTNSGSTNVVAATDTPLVYTANPGQLLFSQCAQCHGTNGYEFSGGFEGLIGEADEITKSEMLEEGGIMRIHGLAYTDAEITLMRNFLMSYSGSNPNGSYVSSATSSTISSYDYDDDHDDDHDEDHDDD